MLDVSTHCADMAFLVRDDWQGRGMGGFLVRYLVQIARDKCVRGITAQVLPDNRAMLSLFYKLGFTVQNRFEEGAYHLRFDIWEPAEGFKPSPDRCRVDPG